MRVDWELGSRNKERLPLWLGSLNAGLGPWMCGRLHRMADPPCKLCLGLIICLVIYTCVCLVSQSYPTLWTVACQATLSVGVFRQEYWSRLPFLPPRDLPHLGIKLESPVFFLTQGSDPHLLCLLHGGQSPYLR